MILSAVKSNIGHGGAASGIAGIMKSAFILEKGNILPVYGLKQLNKNIDLRDGRLKIACYNSPESFTLSGDEAAIQDLKRYFDEKGVFTRIVATGGNAYHSHHKQAFGEGYESLMEDSDVNGKLKQLTQKNGNDARTNATFFSSVFARRMHESEACGPKYWRTNLESPVKFYQAVESLIEATKPSQIIEIGPHTALQGPLRRLGKSWDATAGKIPEYFGTIQRKSDNVVDMLNLAGELFIRGVQVDMLEVNDCGPDAMHPGRTIVDLLKY